MVDQGPRHERRHARAVADRFGLAGQAAAAGKRSDACLQGHLRASRCAHPAAARHRDGQTARPHGARHSHQGFTGTTMIRSLRQASLSARRGPGGGGDVLGTGTTPLSRPGAARRPACARPAGAFVPRRHRRGVVERHRHGRHGPLSDRPGGRRFQRLRGRGQAGRDAVQPDEPADRARRSCSTPAPAWKPGCLSRRKPPSASPGVSGRRISPKSSASTAASSSSSPSRTAQPSSSRRFARPRPAAPRRCTTRSTSR